MTKFEPCLNCGSINMRFYDGLLGYEAVICNDCGTHHTHTGVYDKNGNLTHMPYDHETKECKRINNPEAAAIIDFLKNQIFDYPEGPESGQTMKFHTSKPVFEKDIKKVIEILLNA